MMQSENAVAGSSRLGRPRKPAKPFVASDHRPAKPDGKLRVVIISSGSVASVKIPNIVGELVKDPNVEVQVVATQASLHFYSQSAVDEAVSVALQNGQTKPPEDYEMVGSVTEAHPDLGVKVWTDQDEWADWKKLGDPILHIELRRWADLVVIAPCSADMLAKIAGGLCDNLATSLLRALTPDTRTILCPAMNTHMFQHPLTADHLRVAQEKLGYMILGPQGTGKLACGDEGPGKMTDWRDIVMMIQDFAGVHKQQAAARPAERRPVTPPRAQQDAQRPDTPPTPGVSPTFMQLQLRDEANRKEATPKPGEKVQQPPSPRTLSIDHWNHLTNGVGGDGRMWDKKWWIG